MLNNLKIWARDEKVDGVTENPQRRGLLDSEYEDGLLRKQTVTTQIFNSLNHLLTKHSNPITCSPYLFFSGGGQAIPDQALELNGQALDINITPDLYAVYGTNLPDLTAEAPTGFTYVVRKQ